MKNNVLITGGVGYIGSHMTQFLLDKGFSSVVVDNLSQGRKENVKLFQADYPDQFNFEKKDLRSFETVREIFEKYKITGIIDFAAKSIVPESQKKVDLYFENNVLAFLNIVRCAKKYGNIPIVKSSTAAVYGSPEKKYIPLEEAYVDNRKYEKPQLKNSYKSLRYLLDRWRKVIDDLNGKYSEILELNKNDLDRLFIPINIYGVTKVFDEIILRKCKEKFGLPSVALRYFNAAGAFPSGKLGENHDPETHIIPIIIKMALKKQKIFEFRGNDFNTKDGSGVRDYIHVMDLARAHLLALENIYKVSKKVDAINLGSGMGFSVWDIVRKIQNISQHQFKFHFKPRRSGDPDILIADVKRAQKELKWKAQFGLDSIIKHAWKWHKKNLK